jgi:hypothetical protein
LKTADGSKNQSIESMRKYENPSNQKFKKSACTDLGNRCSIHLSYGSAPAAKYPRHREWQARAISLFRRRGFA